ncbi:hypothetical protein [Methylocystis parvus]|uniref:Uncharacterized protein n=1 Tax=Methylocystis parvus TaxID=134 RepID=A0A6B8M4D2_9HYPH|nr:hypothetical protein [Methylocystis parvus]QGM97208.1 hypothetical protein F7D14_06775 [Methylocystis parvus]WBJ98885.1 hypothetical protein MMG94_12840 [Methylocystis parvus OBBP]
MKLSSRLRTHQWKASSLSPGDHGWEYCDDPIKAADLLDECEAAIRDVAAFAEKSETSGDAVFPQGVLAGARAALAKLLGRPIESDVTAVYVREDNRSRALPLDVDAAIDIIREEFIAGHTHGTLCATDAAANEVAAPLHAETGKDWMTFEVAARNWLVDVRDAALRKTPRT